MSVMVATMQMLSAEVMYALSVLGLSKYLKSDFWVWWLKTSSYNVAYALSYTKTALCDFIFSNYDKIMQIMLVYGPLM